MFEFLYPGVLAHARSFETSFQKPVVAVGVLRCDEIGETLFKGSVVPGRVFELMLERLLHSAQVETFQPVESQFSHYELSL